MKLTKYGVAAAIAATALPGAAHAAAIVGPTSVQTSSIDQGANNSFVISFSDTGLGQAPATFNETISFTTDVAGLLDIFVGTTGSRPENNVTFGNIFLTGTGILAPGAGLVQIQPDPNDGFARNNFAVAAGTYTLTIQGTPGTQNGGLNGTIGFTAAAVPEPGTWALMLVGFGAIGFSMRRRRSQSAHIFQAA